METGCVHIQAQGMNKEELISASVEYQTWLMRLAIQ